MTTFTRVMMCPSLGLLVVLAACAGDDENETAPFQGTWTYQPGSIGTLNCANSTGPVSVDLTGIFEITPGATSDLLVPSTDDRCPPLRFDVRGASATLQAGQTCIYTETTPSGEVTTTTTFATGMLGLDSAGTLSGSQTSSMSITGAFIESCAASSVMSATR